MKLEHDTPSRRSPKRKALAYLSLVAFGLATVACGDDEKDSTETTAPSGEGTDTTSAPGETTADADIVARATEELAPYMAVKVFPSPTEGPTAAADKDVWFVSCGLASPACADGADAAKAAGDLMGWNTNICDGNFGINDGYSTCVRQAVAASADGIILHDIECDTVKQALVEAKDSNIAVLAVSGADCQGDTTGELQKRFVNFEDYPTSPEYSFLIGTLMGWKIVEATNGQAHHVHYHILGNEGSENVAAGIKSILDQCGDCTFEQRDVPLAQMTPELGAQVESDFLGNDEWNSVSVPFASVFDVGLGAGLERTGRDVFVISASHSVSYFNSMHSAPESMTMATIVSSSLAQAWGAMDDMNRLFNGADLPAQGGFIGIADADHNLPPEGEDFDGPSNEGWFTENFPYRDNYETIWLG